MTVRHLGTIKINHRDQLQVWLKSHSRSVNVHFEMHTSRDDGTTFKKLRPVHIREDLLPELVALLKNAVMAPLNEEDHASRNRVFR